MDEVISIATAQHGADRSLMGGKAAALAALSAEFAVPDWFVITSVAFEAVLAHNQVELNDITEKDLTLPEHLEKEITAATAALNHDADAVFAVRSSAIAEDGAERSFAGQLDSFLNVSAADVLSRVQAVWRSAFAGQVTRYNRSGADTMLPAVIVQRMVAADCAGVGFSVDPVNGNFAVRVISAVAGLADTLVTGAINGDTWHIDREGNTVRQQLQGESPILTDSQRQQVVALLDRVTEFFNSPQDIEWAFAENRLYLLQARPITGLKSALLAGTTVQLWDNSNIVESYSGVTSPLTFSFARYVYQHVYAEFARLMGVSAAKIEQQHNTFRNMLGYVNGHVYYNLLNWYRVLALFPGFQMNRHFMEQMMGVKEALPEAVVADIVEETTTWARVIDTVSFARTVVGLVWHQFRFPAVSRRFYRRLDEALAEADSLETLSLDQLGRVYRNLETRLLRRWDAPLINDFLCMIAFGLSRKQLERAAGEEGLALHNELMIGQGDIISAEPAARIAGMAAVINADPRRDRIIAGLRAADPSAVALNSELARAYHAYIEKFGERCLQELKLESPTLVDDPGPLLVAIANMACRPTGDGGDAGEVDIDQALTRLLPGRWVKRRLLRTVLLWAKSRVRDRENLRFERTRIFGCVRKIFVHIGTRLHAMELLENPRDIFYLEADTILGLIEGTATDYDLKSQVACRRRQLDDFITRPDIPNRFQTCGAAVGSFPVERFHESGRLTPAALDSDSVQGTGCCRGTVRAPVRVIDDPRDAKILPGEIMVARFTDPGWITLFANASGILVERGSLLSHSAIVSREMGIPAVVAIDGVMDWLQTGDVVEMDGTTGVVRKLSGEKDGGAE